MAEPKEDGKTEKRSPTRIGLGVLVGVIVVGVLLGWFGWYGKKTPGETKAAVVVAEVSKLAPAEVKDPPARPRQPKVVECHAGTPDLKFFETTVKKDNNGEAITVATPVVWLSYDRDGDKRYTCFDGPGADPYTGADLKPVTSTIARQIRCQRPPEPPCASGCESARESAPVATPTTAPPARRPVVQATGDADLSEGPCCKRR